MLSINQVAQKLNVNYLTVYRWIKENKLKALRVGKLWRIEETELENFLESSKKGRT